MWRESWTYNLACLKDLVDETKEEFARLDQEALVRFQEATAELHSNWDCLGGEEEFRGRTSPSDKLEAVLEPFVEKLRVHAAATNECGPHGVALTRVRLILPRR
ncbi:MAG: hypothetical protein ACTSYX_03345 [Candidatus Thorarchaeota archaeon]